MKHTKNSRIYSLPQKGIDASHFASDLPDLSDDIELRFSVLKDLLDQLDACTLETNSLRATIIKMTAQDLLDEMVIIHRRSKSITNASALGL
ncbi:hypothetical protein PPL19_03850 [Pseudomonas psychrotolerans L19]|uniref:hypothetical protein n=1 Tax=Pseudomonas oryzihabitans TaxID=47885 RepID=UPI00023A4C2E|nr:hypothetical protein [Pseudomonas psychrotolerans]EHK72041.1 hypothetical protein PPL19_03850 [Pseudomonas psychrotolerans L19]MBA1182471.1 hypothetical protein [Pseudomonas psychrotolerans]MBA1210493.1 hypothetical protein [Pseudomonas psychrotolerans]